MSRFVILEHGYPTLHWDLMLEVGERLRTWRLAEPPASDFTTTAEAIADHRASYLDFEGPVSGNRGTVRRWDAGNFHWIKDELACVSIELKGQRLSGVLRLTAMGGQWQASFEATVTDPPPPASVRSANSRGP